MTSVPAHAEPPVHTPLYKTRYESRFGIAPKHWDAFSRYAVEKGLFIFVRGGKEAAIPWVELGLPGKPIEIKAKVDPEKGVLFARTPEQRAEVFQAEHLVLTKTPAGLRAVGRDGRPLPRAYGAGERWAEEHVVIDRASGLAFTSDYDLAAVIPARGEYEPGGQVLQVKGPSGEVIATSYTNATVEWTCSDLNRIFGSLRLRHGSQAIYDQSLPNRKSEPEPIVAFCPNREAYWFETAVGQQEAMQQFHELTMAIRPDSRPALLN